MRIVINFCIVFILFGLSKLSFAQKDYQLTTLLVNGARFLILKGDTVFYESRVIDKPSYFTGFDTLIRQKNDSYLGRMMTLNIELGNYQLSYHNDYSIYYGNEQLYPYSQNKEWVKKKFKIANSTQIEKWNYYHNSDSYNNTTPFIKSIIDSPTLKKEFRTKLYIDWNDFVIKVSKLNQEEFQRALFNFKKDHLLLD
jgi:hypothetical protein